MYVILGDKVYSGLKAELKLYSDSKNIFNKIDDYEVYLERAQEENYLRWATLGTYVWPNPVYFDTHSEEIDHLKSWLTSRMNWLNNQFE